MSFQNDNRNPLQSSIMATANVVAFMAAVVASPIIYDYTAEPVLRLLADAYGPRYQQLRDFAWAASTFMLVFFPARAVVFVGLTVLTSAVAFRML